MMALNFLLNEFDHDVDFVSDLLVTISMKQTNILKL